MHLVQNLKFGKRKGQSGGIIQKGEPHERNPCAPGFEEQHLTKPHDKQIVTAKQRGIWREKCTLLSKRDLGSDKKGYLEKVQRSYDGTDREKESANKRGRTSFVHDFDLFVTVRLLDEMPAVPSLHTLCSKYGNPFEWKRVKLHDWPTIGSHLIVQRTSIPTFFKRDVEETCNARHS